MSWRAAEGKDSCEKAVHGHGPSERRCEVEPASVCTGALRTSPNVHERIVQTPSLTCGQDSDFGRRAS